MRLPTDVVMQSHRWMALFEYVIVDMFHLPVKSKNFQLTTNVSNHHDQHKNEYVYEWVETLFSLFQYSQCVPDNFDTLDAHFLKMVARQLTERHMILLVIK